MAREGLHPRVVLVTGASSGIGQACAGHLASKGHRVYRASRHPQPGAFDPSFNIPMNVDDAQSVGDGLGRILKAEGRIDVVVNAAGYGLAGSIEDTSIAEAQAQFETNFFGVVRVCRGVLPQMRAQHSGLIINVSSIGGLISIPFQAFYSASKFAVEGLTEALRLEVGSFGIRVVLIEPGEFQTNFAARRATASGSEASTAYRERFRKALAKAEADEANGHAPVAVARLVERIMRNPSPRLRYTVGPTFERISPRLKSLLPDRLTAWLTLRYFGLL